MKTLQSVLDEACGKAGLDPAGYSLFHGKTSLDLGGAVRFANLPHGAKIEVRAGRVVAAGPCEIAVQLDDARAIVKADPRVETVWGALAAAGGALGRDLLAVFDNRGMYVQPVAVWMGTKVDSVAAMRSTTLAMLGISGGSSGVMRVTYTPTNLTRQMVDDAIAASAPPAAAPVAAAPAATATAPLQAAAGARDERSPSSAPASPMMAPASPAPASGDSAGAAAATAKPVRPFRVFAAPPEGSNVSLNLELPDSFFEPTPEDFAGAQGGSFGLSSQGGHGAGGSQPATFKTKMMRDLEDEQRRNKLPKTMVRFRFHDRTQIEAEFRTIETVQKVYDFLDKKILREGTAPYYLFTTPPVKRLTDKTVTLWKAGYAPAVVIYFSFEDQAASARATREFVRDDVLERIEDLPDIARAKREAEALAQQAARLDQQQQQHHHQGGQPQQQPQQPGDKDWKAKAKGFIKL